jgi:hypothetical protein
MHIRPNQHKYARQEIRARWQEVESKRLRYCERMAETVVCKFGALELAALVILAVLVYPLLDCSAVTKIHSCNHQHTLLAPCASWGCNITAAGAVRAAILSCGEAERPKGGSRNPRWEGSSGA